MSSIGSIKLEFHNADTDTDILARILADTSDTSNFLKLFLWQAERHADILATIPREDVRVGVGVGVVEFQLYDVPARLTSSSKSNSVMRIVCQRRTATVQRQSACRKYLSG